MSRPYAVALRLARQCETVHRPNCIPLATLPYHTRISHFSLRCKRSYSAQKSAQDGTSAAKKKQELLRTGAIPEDIGLLPDTFIMPRPSKRPSWTSQFRQRLRLERARLRRRLFDAAILSFYRFSWHVKPKPRLNLRQIPRAAENLHSAMYQHFAAGNLEPFRSSIIPGFLSRLRARIATRASKSPLRWKLHELKSPSKLVSYKVALLPGPGGEKPTERRGIIQAVVRIHSLQSLHHTRRIPVRGAGKKDRNAAEEVIIDSRGREIPESEFTAEEARRDAKELVEYVVLQKSIMKSKEGPWKIWGTTDETTLEKLDSDPEGESSGPIMVRSS